MWEQSQQTWERRCLCCFDETSCNNNQSNQSRTTTTCSPLSRSRLDYNDSEYRENLPFLFRSVLSKSTPNNLPDETMLSQRMSSFSWTSRLVMACLVVALATMTNAEYEHYDVPLEKADPPLMKPREYVTACNRFAWSISSWTSKSVLFVSLSDTERFPKLHTVSILQLKLKDKNKPKQQRWKKGSTFPYRYPTNKKAYQTRRRRPPPHLQTTTSRKKNPIKIPLIQHQPARPTTTKKCHNPPR